MKGSIVFDFDGVLADSFDPLYRMNRDAMERAGLPFTTDDYRDLFLDNVHYRLDRMFDDPAKKEVFMAYKDEHFYRYYEEVKLFAFAPELVRSLSAHFRLGIVSSTPKPCIQRALAAGGLASDFQSVCGSQAQSKESELKETVLAFDTRPARTFFVTDSVGDVKLGRQLGFETLGVGWGFQAPDLLEKAGARIFAAPHDLIQYLRDPRNSITEREKVA